MDRKEKLNLYLTFLSERKDLTVYSHKKSLSYLKTLISYAFNIPQNVDFRLQKFHSVSKRPYTVENIDFLNSGDEITVELISDKATYARIDHINSQEEPKFLSNDPSELNNEDSIIDHRSTSISNDHQSNHQIQNHEPTERRFVNLTDYQSQIIDSERAPEKKKRGRPGGDGGKFDAGLPGFGIGNLDVFTQTTAKKLSPESPPGISLNFTSLRGDAPGGRRDRGRPNGGVGGRDGGFGRGGAAIDRSMSDSKSRSDSGHRSRSYSRSPSPYTKLHKRKRSPKRSRSREKRYLNFVDDWKTCVQKQTNNTDKDCLKQCKICEEYFGAIDFRDHENECKKFKEKIKNDEKMAIQLGRELQSETLVNAIQMKAKDCLKQCKICEEYFGAIDFRDHENECKKFKEKIENDEKMAIELDRELQSKTLVNAMQIKAKDSLKQCKICEEYFGAIDFRDHENDCKEFKEKIENDEKMAIQLGRELQSEKFVNAMQMRALLYVQKESEKKSKAAYPKLLERFQKLKYNELDLKKTLEHIRTRAQIMIHFNPVNVMQFFVKDTHYRNCFEIQNMQYIGGRSEWEDRIFGNEYKRSAPFDRVKYGVLNIVNDPSGVKACLGYGDSYLALNSETVCLRTTFASGDTSGMVELASCENYAHVLATYNDNELQDVISVAIGEKICESSNKIAVYKEVQIHGPVEFKRDVVAIVVNSVHKKNKSVTRNVEEFAKINNVNLIWME